MTLKRKGKEKIILFCLERDPKNLRKKLIQFKCYSRPKKATPTKGKASVNWRDEDESVKVLKI